MVAGEVGVHGDHAVPPAASDCIDVTAPVTPLGRPRTAIPALVTVSTKLYAWSFSVKVCFLIPN